MDINSCVTTDVESNRQHARMRAILNILEDVSQSRKELEESKSYVDNIIKSMIDTLIVIDPEGMIKTINLATTELLGYSEGELIGMPFNIIFEEEHSLKDAGLKKLIEDGFVTDYDGIYETKSGGKIPICISGSVMRNKDGKLIGIVIVAKDMRKIKQLMQKEKELAVKTAEAKIEKDKAEELAKAYQESERSNKELEQFAYVAAHDMQEPLRSITSFANILKNQYKDAVDEEGQDYLNRMHRSAERMKQLIDSLLHYSRITTIKKPPEMTDLGKIVHEVVKDLEWKISEEKAEIEIGKLPTVNAIPLQMHQLFQNLILNALKYRKKDEHPKVLINSTLLNDGTAEITIEDNGIGFDEKYVEKIFQPFKRLHSREKYEGTGIGLAICEKVVYLHNGKITARSTPDKGSTFIITMPIK